MALSFENKEAFEKRLSSRFYSRRCWPNPEVGFTLHAILQPALSEASDDIKAANHKKRNAGIAFKKNVI
jgi:hypothetical protein